MPVYHFNVLDGANARDIDGTALPTIQVARLEAVRMFGQILNDQPEAFWIDQEMHVEVTNGRADPLHFKHECHFRTFAQFIGGAEPQGKAGLK